MASPDRLHVPVRLLPEQHDRVSKAARRRGLSRAAFLLEAGLEKCADIEEERRLKRQRKHGFVPDDGDEQNTHRQGGLGIRDALTKKSEPNDNTDEPKATAPVVVNVNTGAAANDPIIEKLATFIVKGGPVYMRDIRRRKCDEIFRATASNNDERRQLGTALDAEVQKLDAKRESASGSTLDKLKAFFK